MDIPWDQPVQLNDKDRGRLIDLTLGEAVEVGEGDGVNVDLADREQVATFFEAAISYLGGLDIAVINAAVPADALLETSATDLDYQVEADFTSYLRTTRAPLIRMTAGSDVVLIGSMSAVSQGPGSSIYVAAKAGIEGFAHSLRQEVSEKDIKVGLIEPALRVPISSIRISRLRSSASSFMKSRCCALKI